jgi:hypothetical protein
MICSRICQGHLRQIFVASTGRRISETTTLKIKFCFRPHFWLFGQYLCLFVWGFCSAVVCWRNCNFFLSVDNLIISAKIVVWIESTLYRQKNLKLRRFSWFLAILPLDKLLLRISFSIYYLIILYNNIF